ncbi:uncharacterized protein LOC117639496 [Thrips palmi]|uniref:Uncharacterized protein LOC117639496 n=1 Tax=Thrips palmi TaxID=161013 RepID=A0A6P8XVT8_THRPL|nr:uncharacterized protein LOC117639496 [Thrips palmi]XP_034231102.1 uncharacterized protein LOC117639496 [Thrips palmi]XP_034231103.1 uncharacterized protein LOC117639496 [Thrips palmi]XP_034231104.1 uncharacterized protein LOC117639496 [Thrips palmi]XP_034231106.1 uncharacterized protein LOC117639496 [Thrips palmi]XP_034231107.1 uncharacterized protein LOC117639496 [Thrips palmi]XP_034231108.1 uncharacterized protein LOC117639496 [Thrips palmi]XP_034231109.1 uncharacterized protein LOC1176
MDGRRSTTRAAAAAAEKRSRAAEFFDCDGARRKRPMTRRQAEVFSQCDQTVQDYEHNVVDVLPDEALLLVFARMASVDLLPLRLVCRRWDELILTPAVWSRRRLCFPSMALEDIGSSNAFQAAFVLYCAPAMDTVDLELDCSHKHRPITPALLRGRCMVRALRCSLTLKEESADTLYDFFRRVQPSLQSLNVELNSSGLGVNAVLANVLGILDGTPLTTLALRCGRRSRFLLPAQDFQFRKLQSLQTLLVDDRVLALDLQKGLVHLNQNSLRQVTCYPELLPALAECPRLREVTVTASSSLRDLHKLTTLEALALRWTDPCQAEHIRDYFDGVDAVEGFKLPSEMHLIVADWYISPAVLTGIGKGLSKFTTLTYVRGLGPAGNLDFISPMDSLINFRVRAYSINNSWADLRSSSLRKIELLDPGHKTEAWQRWLMAKLPAMEITIRKSRPAFLRGFGYNEL